MAVMNVKDIAKQAAQQGMKLATSNVTSKAPAPKINQTPTKTSSKSSSKKTSSNEDKMLKQQQEMINKQFGEAQGLYDRQLSELQALQPSLEQNVIQGYESQRPILQQQFQTGMENIGMQREQVGQTRETALASARRQYEQGLQKSQQLFGGVAPSAVGQASADILAGEQLRQTGQVATQSAQNMMQLGASERELQANLANSLQQLEVRKQADLSKLRDTFRQELNAINTQKGNLALNKANAQLQALQDYNTRKRQLEDMATQQRMNIETYAQQLALQARYNTANQNKISQIPNFASQTDQQRAETFKNLLTTDAGQKALQASGYEVIPNIGGEKIIYNPFNGETYNLGGFRYTDFSPKTFEQGNVKGQPATYTSLLGVPGRIGTTEYK